jgi:hypothetical protein
VALQFSDTFDQITASADGTHLWVTPDADPEPTIRSLNAGPRLPRQPTEQQRIT